MCRGALERLDDKVELHDKFLLRLLKNLYIKKHLSNKMYFSLKDELTGKYTCIKCKKEKDYFDFDDYEDKRICKKCSEKIEKKR